MYTGSEVMRDGYDSSRSCLCEHCAITCTMAYSTLDPFFQRCLSGTITLGETTMATKKKDRLLELYSACLSTSNDEESKLKLRFKNVLNIRFEQASAFCKKKGMLSLFCEHLQRCREPIEGM